MAKKIVWKHSTYVYVLADTKIYVPIKKMVVTDIPKEYIFRGTLQKKKQIHITSHLLSTHWKLVGAQFC